MVKRIIASVFLAGFFFPAILFGQTLSPGLLPAGLPALPSVGEGSAGTDFLSGLPLIQGLKTEKILLNPFAQVGYLRNAVSMNVPIDASLDPFPLLPLPHLQIGTTDIKLVDYNFWMGTVGLNAVISPTLTLFVSAGGFLPREFTEEGRTPISFGPVGGAPETMWTGSKLEFWTIQWGMAYGLGGSSSILAGMLWSHTSNVFGDPRNQSGPLRNQTLSQDFLLTNWAPFLGIQVMQEGYYRGALICSPYLTSWGAQHSRTTLPVPTDLSWNLNQPGYLLSFTGEYFFPSPAPKTTGSIWFTASMLSMKGSSELQFESPIFSQKRTVETLSLNQYTLGGGLSFGVIF